MGAREEHPGKEKREYPRRGRQKRKNIGDRTTECKGCTMDQGGIGQAHKKIDKNGQFGERILTTEAREQEKKNAAYFRGN